MWGTESRRKCVTLEWHCSSVLVRAPPSMTPCVCASSQARAWHNVWQSGKSEQLQSNAFHALSFFAPDINLCRDPVKPCVNLLLSQHSTARCTPHTAQHTVLLCVLCSVLLCSVLLCSVQCAAVQCAAVQCAAVQCAAVQ
jgi:hypothetical protein